MNIQSHYQIIALFSGGLDSILAAKVMQEQGLSVLCLHYYTPFFGNPQAVDYWKKLYQLDIVPIDIGDIFVDMLVKRPEHGFGSVLNPCVDCKVLLMRHAKQIMHDVGAHTLVSGEVIGQRPMSQRRDTLHIIARDAGVADILLRPLCAKLLPETQAERAGLVDRDKLLALSGRSRKGQMELAAHFSLRKIPTPAGGCLLAERENARSYWPVLQYCTPPTAADFYLANTGRQLWSDAAAPHWLVIGRKEKDNQSLLGLAKEDDLLFKIAQFPGPIGLGRPVGAAWSEEAIHAAATLVAGYSSKAVAAGKLTPVDVRVHTNSLDTPGRLVKVTPSKEPLAGMPVWKEREWDAAKQVIRQEARLRNGHGQTAE